jgi:DNA-directed RNA polymerase specialized sigma24 family protein
MVSLQLPISPNTDRRQDEEGSAWHKMEAALKRGEQEPIEKLYNLYAPALLGIIFKTVDCSETAEEILKETFIKVSTSIDQYQESKCRLFSWLACQARSTATAYLDRNTKIRKHCAENSLKSDDEILNMIYFQGYSHSEVAKNLDLPLEVVKAKMRAALLAQRKSS